MTPKPLGLSDEQLAYEDEWTRGAMRAVMFGGIIPILLLLASIIVWALVVL